MQVDLSHIEKQREHEISALRFACDVGLSDDCIERKMCNQTATALVVFAISVSFSSAAFSSLSVLSNSWTS